jgi:hypothetical protein
MKNILCLLLFIGFVSTLNAQKDKQGVVYADYYNILNVEQLNYFKKNYSFDSEKILIINYKQPKLICSGSHRHSHNNQVKKW